MAEVFTNPARTFCEAFPEAWLRRVVRIVAEAYSSRSSYRYFPSPEMNNLWPDIRRAKIESDLRHIAEGYEGLTARTETNSRGNSHTLVERGQVAFTQAHVHSPKDLVRRAVHRDQLARGNRPYFPSMANDMEPTPGPGASLFAMFIHDASSTDPDRLGFIDVVFPSPDGRSYLDDRIHLISFLADMAQGTEAAEEQISSDLPSSFGLRDIESERGA